MRDSRARVSAGPPVGGEAGPLPVSPFWQESRCIAGFLWFRGDSRESHQTRDGPSGSLLLFEYSSRSPVGLAAGACSRDFFVASGVWHRIRF